MYTERLDIAMADVAAVKEVAQKCRLEALLTSIEAELRTLKYYFKTTRREEAPRRSVLPIHPCFKHRDGKGWFSLDQYKSLPTQWFSSIHQIYRSLSPPFPLAQGPISARYF